MYSVLADTKPIRAGCVDVRWDITEERSQMRSAASMTHSGGGGWPTSYITARWHRFPVPALVITSRPSVVPSARRHRVSILQHDPFRDPSEVPVPAAPLVPGVPHGQRHVRGSGGGARADPDARAKPNRAGPRQGARGVRRSAEPEQGSTRRSARRRCQTAPSAARTTTRPSCFVCQGP
jgi:hypothetical protein